MKKIKAALVSAIMLCAALVAGVQSASAGGPLRFGVKAGVNVNEMKFNESAFDASNRSGFTGGVTLQFVAPILNIGVDASVMYTHRQNRIYFTEDGETEGITSNSDYIEIPVNFRWNISVPLISKVVTPYLFTGPDFSFLMSNKNVKNAWNNRTFDLGWNFGLGLRFVDHLEIGASYGLGITNSASADNALYGKNLADGKNRFWTITAAWLF